MKRMGFVLIGFVVVISFLTAKTALADTLTSLSGATWQSTWTTGNGGTPFFDNGSSDGTYDNIGYFITDTGAWGTTGPVAIGVTGTYTGPKAILPYSGTATGGADTSFYFANGSSEALTMQIAIAGNAANNTFGYFLTTAAGVIIAGSEHQLFTGSTSPGQPATFTVPAGDGYGFYLDTGTLNGNNAANNNFTTIDNGKQFAVFQGANGTFWIGAEDILLPGGDKDYNDLVVELTPANVPEPITLVFLGFSLFGFAALGRKIRK